MASLQRAPEPTRQAAQYVYRTSHGGGDGNPPQTGMVGPLEVGLSNDNRAKSSLNRLVLVLPLAVLIFEQAISNPVSDIELPVLKIKVAYESVLPILLMLISYMLYRALRYARIVLWNIGYLPKNMEQVGQIVLDNSDAYKINSSHYEEVVDSMGAALLVRWGNLRREWVKTASWYAVVGYNLVATLIVYSAIFLALVVTAAYVSQKWFVLLPPWADLLSFGQTLSTKTISVLVLCISASLLLLAWFNVLSTVCVAVWGVLGFAIRMVVWAISFLSTTVIFVPFLPMFRWMFVTGTNIRERHRDRTLAKAKSAYSRRKYDFINANPSVVDFKARRELSWRLTDMQVRLWKIQVNFGRRVLPGGDRYEEGSLWSQTSGRYGLSSLSLCIDALRVLAHRAPVNFLSDEWPQLHDRLDKLLCSYELDPPESFLNLMKEDKIAPPDRQQAVEIILKWLESVPSIDEEATSLRRDCDKQLESVLSSEGDRYPFVDIFRLREIAEKYFAQFDADVAGFAEPEPVRGARDWAFVSRLLDVLRRAARLPEPT